MTDKKFDDKEIVKALRCCVKVRNCGECPLKDEPVSECIKIACMNAADIIERQGTENEWLNIELKAMRGASAFGDFAFLTREEAEKALKGETE